MKKMLALFIIFMLTIPLCACGNSGNINNSRDYDSNISNNNSIDDNVSYNESEKVYYTKGTFDGTVYVNKWADIKFTLPVGFSNADLATYNAVENSNTECGMYFKRDDTMGAIFVVYEKLPTYPVYDESKYLDAVVKSLTEATSIKFQAPEEYSVTTIGGHTYTSAELPFNNGNGDFVQAYFVRKIDNYMVCISVTGVDTEAINTVINNIISTN